MRSAPQSAKDYVESLHQNSKSTLLYGKNNVMVQPVSLLLHVHLPVLFILLKMFYMCTYIIVSFILYKNVNILFGKFCIDYCVASV